MPEVDRGTAPLLTALSAIDDRVYEVTKRQPTSKSSLSTYIPRRLPTRFAKVVDEGRSSHRHPFTCTPILYSSGAANLRNAAYDRMWCVLRLVHGYNFRWDTRRCDVCTAVKCPRSDPLSKGCQVAASHTAVYYIV